MPKRAVLSHDTGFVVVIEAIGQTFATKSVKVAGHKTPAHIHLRALPTKATDFAILTTL